MIRSPRLLLLGASGRLGQALDAALTGPASRFELIAPTRAELDLLDGPAVDALIAAVRPAAIVNTVAISDVDRCELEPQTAHRYNVALPAMLAASARTRGAWLVHFSSDYVFDGARGADGPPYVERDPTRPLSVYGRSKLDGEQAIAAACDRHLVFRVSWLYGSVQRNLAQHLLEPAHAGTEVRLDGERIGVPNPVQLLSTRIAAAIEAVVADGDTTRAGVYHLSCHGRTTWLEFAERFLARAVALGLLAPDRLPRLGPLDAAGPPRPAPRPAYSAMDASRFEQAFGVTMPAWDDALDAWLAERAGRAAR